jgi:hypothetical protein
MIGIILNCLFNRLFLGLFDGFDMLFRRKFLQSKPFGGNLAGGSFFICYLVSLLIILFGGNGVFLH